MRLNKLRQKLAVDRSPQTLPAIGRSYAGATSSPLLALPGELIDKIAQALSENDRFRLGCTCRTLLPLTLPHRLGQAAEPIGPLAA